MLDQEILKSLKKETIEFLLERELALEALQEYVNNLSDEQYEEYHTALINRVNRD